MNDSVLARQYASARGVARATFVALAALLASGALGCASSNLEADVGRTEEALSTGLVISQIYGAGGNSGATYSSDFVELFNRGTTSVSVTGWSVQYASATGTTWTVTTLGSKSVPPGGYFLVQLYTGTTGGALPSADATGSANMSATNGRVALVKSTTALSCGTACKSATNVVDYVGYGTATEFEGSGAAPAPSGATQSSLRKALGCTETDDNAADFTTGAVAPRNSTTSTVDCSTVDASVPDTSSAPDTSVDDTATAPDDTGTVVIDSSAPDDTGSATIDTGSELGDSASAPDVGAPADAGGDAKKSNAASDSGDLPVAPACSCRVGTEHARAASLSWFAIAGVALAARARRRR